ncbi:MAG: hypothetical protein IID36_14780, partial [Planctomycetes bacterium]|nr:hypothetical protein [Planctomycetota bacterium]
MFERRLKATLSLLAFALAIIVGRLVHLQIVRAEFYRDRTSQMMLREPIVLPFVRGRVLDRTGEILVSDEPCWDLCVDYGVIAMRNRHIAAAVKRWGRRNRYPSVEMLAVDEKLEAVKKAYLSEVDQMWRDISRFASLPDADPTERIVEPGSIFERVDKIRRSVAGRRGFDAAVREETWAHPILTGLSADRQIAARETRATRYPWVVVKPASRR